MAKPDPIAERELATRSSKVTADNARELARVQDEATRPSAAKQKVMDEMAAKPRNLTEVVIRDYLENRLSELGSDPAQARELARTRAAQMTGFES